MPRRTCLTALTLLCAPVFAQQSSKSLGLFESSTDVGTVLQKGAAAYDAQAQTYTLSGSGENMWFAKDDFHYVWKKIEANSPNLTLTADIAFPETGGNAHKKAVLMARQSLAADAAYVDVAVHGDGLTSLQAREENGANTHEVGINAAHPTRVRLEKRGDYFYMSLATAANPNLAFAGGSLKVRLTAPFYIGIGVCAHDKNAVEKAVFSRVQLSEQPATTKPTLYSTLETLSVTSTDRRVVFVEANRLSGASWTNDPAVLQFQSGGSKTFHISAKGNAKPSPASVPAPVINANYTTTEHNGAMQIFRRGTDEPEPVQITSDDFANCFPRLSPDGTRLAFVSYEKGVAGCPADKDVTLRVMTLADRQIRTVAKFIGGQGTLDGAPWSPDGKSLVYVSYQFLTP